MKKLNNKGFTLVELIVTIAIIMIIMLIAYPAIDKMSKNNENKIYEEYGKSMVNAARFYVNKNSRDLFAKHDCIKISWAVLNDEDLVKPFNYKKVECSNPYVAVFKSKKNTFKYEYYLYCKDSVTNKVTYQSSTPVVTGCRAINP